MRILYFLLTIPFYVLGKIFIFFNLDDSNTDFLKCCNYLENLNLVLDDEIIDILFLLIPLSVVLALLILGGLAWAIFRGQFESLDGEGQRILNHD